MSPPITASAMPSPVDDLAARLHEVLGGFEGAVVALSAGVDSSVVAALAAKALGPRLLAVTGVSPSLTGPEIAQIVSLCHRFGIRHRTVPTDELRIEGYVANTPERCYFCKGELYGVLARVAREEGLATILDGTCADDLEGHRPGKRAGDELGVRSPLLEVGARKQDVRALARRLGLPNAERPSSPCLSSRIAYGVPVTEERLRRIAQAERALRERGFAHARVRLHEEIARIEVPKADLARAVEQAETIVTAVKAAGFVYVTLDLAGLRSGSLLEAWRAR